MKGNPNLISFEQKPDLAGEMLLFNIRGKQHIVHATREKYALHKHHKREFGRLLDEQFNQIHERTPAPICLHSGNQSLLYSNLDISYTYGR